MANPGVAVPGSVVAIGSQVSPAGPQGIQGPSAVSANANNKATLGSDSLVLVQGTAAGVAATTHAQTVSGDDPQLTNTRTPTAHASTHVTGGSDIIVPASATTAGLLKQLSGNTTDFVDGTNTCQNLASAVQPTIWSVRLRSFNAVQNSAFEVDQRSVGNAVTNPANTLVIDRWFGYKLGTMTATVAQSPIAVGALSIPGTNFGITTKFLHIVLTAQQASLGATDRLYAYQVIEGSSLRGLINDVHSVQILCRSSVANLKFGISLRDSVNGYSLTKLCQLGAAATWTLITLPNLPIWTASGTFPLTPGTLGYTLLISLAGGSTLTAAANDVWAAGNFTAALGQDNFAASAVSSYFDIAYIDHQPGAVSTTPLDCQWQQAYDDALRYFQKSYEYGTAPGSVATNFRSMPVTTAAAFAIGSLNLHKPMAKVPTYTIYNPSTGAANSIRDSASVDHASASVGQPTSSSIGSISFTTALSTAGYITYHYTADTGW